MTSFLHQLLFGEDQPALAPGADSGVAAYQTSLMKLGYPIRVDGVDSPESRDVVRQFQRWASITEDGIVGKNTARELYKATLARKGSIA